MSGDPTGAARVAPVIATRRDGPSPRPSWSNRQVALVSITGAWSVYLGFIALRLAIIRFPREALLLERHVVVVCVGAALTGLLYLMQQRLHRAPIAARIAVGIALALPMAAALTLVNYGIRYGVAPQRVFRAQELQRVTLHGFFARQITEMFLMFTGWSALYASVTSTISGRKAEERAARAEIETREAQLTALRHQLNPHFLFNALNSVSALVLQGNPERADEAIGLLSSFLRGALARDGGEDISLAEEVERQQRYLAIEQLRFGDRLRVRWAVPPELDPVPLPPLLLQPVVENVVRHAVALTERRITVEIRAFVREGCLHLSVQDDGPGCSSASGHGIGLDNVARRLATRYDGRGTLRCGAPPEGGFRVELVLPLGRAVAGGGHG